jgi:hypothetical protein
MYQKEKIKHLVIKELGRLYSVRTAALVYQMVTIATTILLYYRHTRRSK